MRNNRIIVLAFFTVFSMAAAKAEASDNSKELPVELKYAGHVHNQPLYKLVVNDNKALDEFSIQIRDEYGETLYDENIKAENYTKSFVLNTNEIGDETLYFEIINRTTGQSVSYEISRYSHLEKEEPVMAAAL